MCGLFYYSSRFSMLYQPLNVVEVSEEVHRVDSTLVVVGLEVKEWLCLYFFFFWKGLDLAVFFRAFPLGVPSTLISRDLVCSTRTPLFEIPDAMINNDHWLWYGYLINFIDQCKLNKLFRHFDWVLATFRQVLMNPWIVISHHIQDGTYPSLGGWNS